MQKKLNICLHNIVATVDDIETIYDLTKTQLFKVVEVLKDLRLQSAITSYEIFFDDGYKSARDIMEYIDFGIDKKNIHIAIITDLTNEPGRLTDDDIISLAQEGYTIDSHGTSHAALAVFSNDVLQESPRGGKYQNSNRGKSRAITTEEIKYQLLESYEALTNITNISPNAFVLPYGLYNQQVVYLAANTAYRRIYTCDSAFDSGQFLAPRLIITQETVDQLDTEIRQLPSSPHLLVE